MSADSSFCLAQVSDPHLTTLAGADWSQFLNKRILGYLSWRRRRRFVHCRAVLDALLDDTALEKAAMIAVTGDLTHVGLPEEYRQAADWLRQLGDPQRVQVIPGNHEAYIRTSWQQGLGIWAPYLCGDDSVENHFPALRIRGELAIIGLNSAIASPPLLAIGRLGRTQLDALRAVLTETGTRGLCRVVLVHHPAVPGTEKWRKRLVDAPALCQVIAECGAELVLHGHSHRWQEASTLAAGRQIPVLGIPSASSSSRDPARTGAYALYRIIGHGDAWQIEISRHVYRHDDKRFALRDRQAWRILRCNR